MKYNIYIEIDTNPDPKNILSISEDNLKKVVKAYKTGKEKFFIEGEKYFLEDVCKLKIFTIESENYTKGDIVKICKEKSLYQRSFMGEYIPPENLNVFGNDVTSKYIKGDYGYLQEEEQEESINIIGQYVAKERIQEIRQIENSNFDFTKFVKMLEELNIAYSKDMVYTVAILVRAIKDHIPPIFRKKEFEEVANSRKISTKRSFMNLQNSLKNIADAYMHIHIRKKENLPNMTQVDFKNDLDVLLQEIVRICKN